MNPDQRPRIALDQGTANLQAQLEAKFPGVEQTFFAVVSSSDAETSRQQAQALAANPTPLIGAALLYLLLLLPLVRLVSYFESRHPSR